MFVATYDQLHKLDLHTGALVWEIDTGSEMATVSFCG